MVELSSFSSSVCLGQARTWGRREQKLRQEPGPAVSVTLPGPLWPPQAVSRCALRSPGPCVLQLCLRACVLSLVFYLW